MLRANVGLLDGTSFTADLDPREPVKSLRAQVEQQLEVPRYFEVRLLRLAQEEKILNDGDDVVLDVQAVQVPSLSRVAESLEAAAEGAWTKDDGGTLEECLSALDNVLAAVDGLQPSAREDRRVLEAMIALARRCRHERRPHMVEFSARLGRLFARTCADVDPFVVDLVNDGILHAFSVCAFAQLTKRSSTAALQPHEPQIRRLLDKAMRNLKFLLCALAESASLADAFVELVAEAGDGAFATRLEEERLPQLFRFADCQEDKLVAISRLEGALARLRERLALSP